MSTIFQSCRDGATAGYYQDFWGGKCILLKDTTRRKVEALNLVST